MKHLTGLLLLVLLAAWFLSGCASPHSAVPLNTSGFSNDQRTSSGVESSLVTQDGSLKMLVDPFEDGTLSIGSVTDNRLTGLTEETKNMRFSYVFSHGGTYFLFANRGGSVFAWSSPDLTHWSALNSGRAVLTPQVGTVTATLWNVGADIDESGVFHLFAESSASDNAHACLTYFNASLSGDSLDFNPSRPDSCFVPSAGNPFVKFIPGKGLLLLFGDISSGTWVTSAGVVDLSGVFRKSSVFQISAPGIHVCDPSMEELNGQLYLSVSVDQREIHTMSKAGNFSQMFDSIEKE